MIKHDSMVEGLFILFLPRLFWLAIELFSDAFLLCLWCRICVTRWFLTSLFYSLFSILISIFKGRWFKTSLPEALLSIGTVLKRVPPSGRICFCDTNHWAADWTLHHSGRAPLPHQPHPLSETHTAPPPSASRNVHDRSTSLPICTSEEKKNSINSSHILLYLVPKLWI